MSSFTKNLNVEFLGMSNNMMIKEEVSFYSEKACPGLKTTLKPGFISDGGSINRYIEPIARANDRKYQIAYAFHDAWWRLWAYYEKYNPHMVPMLCHEEYLELHIGNLLLDEALQVRKMNWWKRQKVYYGLEYFGSVIDDVKLWENAWQFVELEKFETVKEAKELC